MTKTIIFGYGSLINTESLRATVPDATEIRPVYIKGFVRDFSLWDPAGWTTTSLDVAGIPFCAVDVKIHSNPESKVNGIIFEVSEAQLSKLIEREREYELIKTIAHDFISAEPIGECLLFSANKKNGSFDFGVAAQMRYLQVCLEGAKQHGEAFYQEFLGTTFINDKPLSERESLLNSQLY